MKKEVEQLLISLGQTISGYEYLKSKPVFEEEVGEETVTIGGKEVPLNKRLLNYKKIEYFLFGDGDNGLSKCINHLQVNKDNYNAMINITSGYLGDILKYANEMIPDSIELIEALIIRVSNNINANSVNFFRKYDSDIEQAERNIQMELSERQAKTLYDAENNKMISATIYPHRNILGIETGMISVSSRSLVNVDAEMEAHRFSANMMHDIEQNSAKKELSKKLYEMISDEITTFAVQFEDILVSKREDIFDKIDYRSNDITICPYKYLSYIKNEKFNKEDFPNIKKVLKYYDILDDFIYDLENDIYLKISDSMENSEQIHNSKNQDLYLYLTGKKNINESHNIKEGLYSDYVAELKAMVDDEEFEINADDIRRVKEIVSAVNKNKEFFSDSQYEKISKLVDKIYLKNKNEQQEKRKNNPKRKKRIILLFIFIAIVIFWIIQYFLIKDTEVYGQQLGEFLGVLIVIGIIIGVKKLIKKMRGY